VKTKLDEAGISIWDVGIGKGKYQLCRYQDKGVYTVDNCEFKTHHQNNSEKSRPLSKVMAGGIFFESIVAAGKHFNMAPQSVVTRLNSKNFNDWYRISEKRKYSK